MQEVRARFSVDRARLVDRYHDGEGGGVVVRAYCRLVDEIVRSLAPLFFSDPGALALVAVGGYGRGELAFGSDVDLHLLHEEAIDTDAARSFLQALWDLDWTVGHQVVTVSQAQELAWGNPQTLTAYLEMRVVWGEVGLAKRLDERVRSRLVESQLENYTATKVTELEHRHLQTGDTVYLSEPDVKESPGGLRDLHALLWISNAAGGARTWGDYLAQEHLEADQYARYHAAHDLLLRVRNGLHLQKGRAWDRLDHRSQVRLADMMGYQEEKGRLPVEEFMRDYYTAAWQVYAFASVQLARQGWSVEARAPLLLPVLRNHAGDPETWPHAEARSNPLAVIRRVQSLAGSRGSLSPDTVAWLNRDGRLIGSASRRDPAHGQLVMDLLKTPGAAWSLHVLHQLGILGGLLPEFDSLTALVQYDPYHYYTADEHTLRALDTLDALLDTDDHTQREHLSPRLAESIQEIPVERWQPSQDDLSILRLAILYHDSGKGAGTGNHAERGARLLQSACRRMHISKEETEDAVFLVRHHLLLSAAAQRRDSREEALQRRLRRIIRTPRRLHLLGFLTVCDMAALSPNALSAWKCRLLVDLVARVERLMEGVPEAPEKAIHEAVISTLPADIRDRIDEFLDEMPVQYVQSLDRKRVVEDAALIGSYRAGPLDASSVAMTIEHDRETSDITLVTQDRSRLMARICGLLASHDLTILRAQIFTRIDGLVFDRFVVADAASGKSMSDDQVEAIESDISGVLDGSIDVELLLEEHRDRWRIRDRTRMEHAVQVEFDLMASDRYSVIEIRARDHVGLLHDLTGAMADMGVAIHQSFVTTEGERAVDAFYVTDPLGAPLDAPTRKVLKERLLSTLAVD
jgi:[protein-PII] uridylyltransferase